MPHAALVEVGQDMPDAHADADAGVQFAASIARPEEEIESDVLHVLHEPVPLQYDPLRPVQRAVLSCLPLPSLCVLPTTPSCSLISSLIGLASWDL